MTSIAIATMGKSGVALSHQLNRKRGDGTTRYPGLSVIRPDDPMTGHRWNVIIISPESVEASETEREVYRRWLSEVVPTKLHIDGTMIWLDPRTG